MATQPGKDGCVGGSALALGLHGEQGQPSPPNSAPWAGPALRPSWEPLPVGLASGGK